MSTDRVFGNDTETNSDGGGAMWLQGSLISGNEVVLPMIASEGSRGFYSDVPREYYAEMEGALVATTKPPEEFKGVFLSRADPWFKEISEV